MYWNNISAFHSPQFNWIPGGSSIAIKCALLYTRICGSRNVYSVLILLIYLHPHHYRRHHQRFHYHTSILGSPIHRFTEAFVRIIRENSLSSVCIINCDRNRRMAWQLFQLKLPGMRQRPTDRWLNGWLLSHGFPQRQFPELFECHHHHPNANAPFCGLRKVEDRPIE